VADLGLSQIQGQRHLSSSMYKRIIPPEILKGEIWTKKSDVFSYGLILYELLTSKKADTTTIKQISVLYDDNEPGKHGYIELIKACTSSNPEQRPHFEDILKVLEILQEKDVNHQREIRLEATSVEIKGEYV
jgi:serine/threonine protein kinase